MSQALLLVFVVMVSALAGRVLLPSWVRIRMGLARKSVPLLGEDAVADDGAYRTRVEPAYYPSAPAMRLPSGRPSLPDFTPKCPFCGFQNLTNKVCGAVDGGWGGCTLGKTVGPHVHHECSQDTFDGRPFTKSYGCGAKWVSRVPWEKGKKPQATE
jgi:hypothetical protein